MSDPWFTIFLSAKLRVRVQTDVKLLLWFACCKINMLNSYFGLIMKGCLTLSATVLQSHKRSYLVYTGNASALLSKRLLGNYLLHFSDFKHGSPLTHFPKGLWQNFCYSGCIRRITRKCWNLSSLKPNSFRLSQVGLPAMTKLLSSQHGPVQVANLKRN